MSGNDDLTFDDLFSGKSDSSAFDDLFGESHNKPQKKTDHSFTPKHSPDAEAPPDFSFDDTGIDTVAASEKAAPAGKTDDFGFDFDAELVHDDPNPKDRRMAEKPLPPSMNDRRRSANDFQPDMDALLVTAQSSMIIEGTKRLTAQDYSSAALGIYSEAIKGIDLYLKIMQRNPESYRKLSAIIKSDLECSEVERIACGIYKSKHQDLPETLLEKQKAYEYFRDRLKNGYKKATISASMTQIKSYFLLSGGLDIDKVSSLIHANDPAFKTEIAKLNRNIQIAIDLLKQGEGEIARGLKGRDTNVYIIKVSQLLYFYYSTIGDMGTADYYKRIYQNYKKYSIVK